MLHAFRKRLIDGGVADGMVGPPAALAARMMSCSFGGRWSHICASLSALHYTMMTGQRDFTFLSRVATSLRTSVIPE